MSYLLKSADVDRMEFTPERAPVFFRWTVLFLGIVALCAGPSLFYFKIVRGVDLPVMISGFGLILIAAGELLRIQIRGLPARMVLDNRKGELEIFESDGRRFALGYGDFERVALRMRGRGRVIVSLIRTNGAYWDLFRTNRRSLANEMGARVQNFIDQGRRKDRNYPDPGDRFEQDGASAKAANRAIYWQDRLALRASIWILLLLTGLATLAAGFLLRADIAFEIALGGPAAAIGICAAYMLYGLWFDRRGLRESAGTLEYGFTRGAGWVARASFDLRQAAGALYNFDMYGGLPEILLPDDELYPRVTGLPAQASGPGSSKSRRESGLARIKADVRAGLRVRRLSLSGLNAGDALALEFWLEKLRREYRT